MNGFSVNTGLPAWVAARICSACSVCGVASTTASISGSVSTLARFVRSGKPMLVRVGARHSRDAHHADDEANLVALALHAVDEILAPPSEAHDGARAYDHGDCFPPVNMVRSGGAQAAVTRTARAGRQARDAWRQCGRHKRYCVGDASRTLHRRAVTMQQPYRRSATHATRLPSTSAVRSPTSFAAARPVR